MLVYTGLFVYYTTKILITQVLGWIGELDIYVNQGDMMLRTVMLGYVPGPIY